MREVLDVEAGSARPSVRGRAGISDLLLLLSVGALPLEISRLVIPFLRTENLKGQPASLLDFSRLLLIAAIGIRLLRAPATPKLPPFGPVRHLARFGIGLVIVELAYAVTSGGAALSEAVRTSFHVVWALMIVRSASSIGPLRFTRVFQLSMLAQAVLMIGQKFTHVYLINPELALSGRVNGTQVDPNISGRYLAVSLVIWMVVPLFSRRVRLAGAATTAAALLFSGSRGSWLALIIVGVVSLPRLPLVPIRRRVQRALSVSVLVIPAAGFLALNPALLARVLSLRYGTGASGAREQLFRAGSAMFVDHPLFGVGIGNFGPRLLDSYSQFLSYYGTGLTKSHTSLSLVLAEMGAVGLLLVLALLGTWSWLTILAAVKRPAVVASAGARSWVIGLWIVFIASQAEGRLWEDSMLWIAWALAIAFLIQARSMPANAASRAVTHSSQP